MRGEAITIARVRGIDIRLHISWLPIALLVSWALSGSYFPSAAPGRSTGAYWFTGVVVTALFFGSLLLHELAHSLMARARGLHVLGITLYLFGGVSEIGAEAENPGDEFRVTVVGPLTSLGLAAIFWAIWAMSGGASDLVSAAVGYLAAINLFLGLFNLLPGLPLDGGRVLHAFVWQRSGDKARATRVASGAGVAIGYLMVTAGIIYVFTGFWLNGLWLIVLGWYLQGMATQERRAAFFHRQLAGKRVADLAETRVLAVSPEAPVSEIVHDIMLGSRMRAVPVVENGGLLGLVTLDSIGKVPREQWPVTPASAAMIPAGLVATATPDEPIATAIAQMQSRDVNQLAVVRDGSFVGMLNRAAVMAQLQIQSELAAGN